MVYTIYSRQGVKRTDFDTSSNCTHSQKVMGDNVLNLSFTLPEYVILDVNDYIDIDTFRFTLTEPYKPVMKSTLEYQYDVKFYGPESVAKKAAFLDTEYNPITSYFDTPSGQLSYIVKCINRVLGSERYHVGAVVASEPVLVNYTSGGNCLQALDALAKAVKTEWWLDGTSFNLTKCEHGTPITLAYGQGLLQLSKDISENKDFYTRLIPRGSSKNIIPADYGHPNLQLPGGVKYIDRDVNQYGIVEHFEEAAFQDIFPRFEGKVTTVRTEPRTIEKIDRVIYYFTDSAIPFNPNDYEQPGKVKHVVFKSGDLLGQDFEANYDAKKKEWELILQYPTKEIQLPGGNVIPRPGDIYTVYNIKLPKEYYPRAENEFSDAVNKLLDEHAVDYAIYKAPTDHVYLEENNLKLMIGSRVKLLSQEYFAEGYRDSRITAITRKLNDLNDMDIEISNTIIKSNYTALKEDVSQLQTIITQRLADEIINIIRSYQLSDLNDDNVMSSARTLNEIAKYAIAKNKDDSVNGLITFLKGLKSNDLVTLLKGLHVEGGADIDNIHVLEALTAKLVDAVRVSATTIDAQQADIQQANVGKLISDEISSDQFLSGAFGYGMKMWMHNGISYAEVDNLHVRREAVFNKLTIAEIKAVGGQILLTVADLICNRVEVLDTAYRCYFDTNEGAIPNYFAKYDQAICEVFNGQGKKYYWRLVIGVGTDYIDLSKTDCDGSGIPAAGDNIIQLGNRNDASRQSAIHMSAYGIDAPFNKHYRGINSYSLVGKATREESATKSFFTGDLRVVSGSGEVVRVPADRGPFVNGQTYYYYDRVSHNGALWLCLVEEGTSTTAEPSISNPIWQKQVREGGTGYRLEKFATPGYEFVRENQPYNHTLSIRVFFNEEDITDTLNIMRFKWTRVSENVLGDPTWNELHINSGHSINITNADLAGDTSFICKFYDEKNNVLTKTF